MADCATMIESVGLALAIELALRALSFSTLMAFLGRLESSRGPVAAHRHEGDRLGRFAAAAYRLLPVRSTCLRESLVLYGLLRRRGAAPSLRLGVRKDGSLLAAHAWVECAGVSPARAQSAFVELRAWHGQPGGSVQAGAVPAVRFTRIDRLSS